MRDSILMLLFLSGLFISCNNCNPNFIYQPPVDMNDGIAVGSSVSVNIDTAMLTKAVNKINCGQFGEVHSLLIYKDNLLVLEEYFQGHRYKWDARAYHGELVDWDRSMAHEMMSVTKSITSACIGIAIDKGFIKSVHQSIFDYLPNYQHLKVNNREYITIEHLVTKNKKCSSSEQNPDFPASCLLPGMNGNLGLGFRASLMCILFMMAEATPY